MVFQLTFKQMESSDALSDYAEKKFSQVIRKFVTKPVHIHVTFTVEKMDHQLHLSMNAGDGFALTIEEVGLDMYAVIDSAVDKLTRNLRKKKERLKEHKGSKFSKVLERATTVLRSKKVRDEMEAIDAGDILKFEATRRRSGLRPVTIS